MTNSPIRHAVARFRKEVEGAEGETQARIAYRDAFARLRSRLHLHPRGSTPSVVFESAAASLQPVAAQCLPLALALVMHLYPYCALQSVPLPFASLAWFKRSMLLREIQRRSLLLANIGGERTQGHDASLIATPWTNGIELHGACDYMSLASVADVVLCKAQLPDGSSVLCAADLSADTVRIGSWKFGGSMRLSDTAPVEFTGHRVRHGHFAIVSERDRVQCVADYQRCWFHLFLSEIHLARLAELEREWMLSRPRARLLALAEIAHLRAHALRLLDEHVAGRDLSALTQATALLKLRTSLLAQETATRIRDGETADTADLESAAQELGYIRFQPTADEKIFERLELAVRDSESAAVRDRAARPRSQDTWFAQRSLR